MRAVFVHGACVSDGTWWWHRAAALLDEAGWTSVAPGLPTCGEGEGDGLADDVAAVRAVLEAGDEPTVAIGHSYGGIVLAEAAAGVAAVRHLVLVSSYLPEVGESLSTFGPEGGPAPFLAVDPDAGTFTVRAEALAPNFLQDCDEEVQRAAVERIADQRLAVLEAPVRAAAWHDLPTTYVVCAQDRGTPADRQRAFAARADAVVELAAGHHPFLSQPEAVRDVLLAL